MAAGDFAASAKDLNDIANDFGDFGHDELGEAETRDSRGRSFGFEDDGDAGGGQEDFGDGFGVWKHRR